MARGARPRQDGRQRQWPGKALTGLLAFAGLIPVIVAASSCGSLSSPGNSTTPGSTMTASATATGAPGQPATRVAAAAQQTQPGSTQTTSAASQAPAPPTSAPPTSAPTTPAPTTPASTRPAPTTPAAVAPPPTSMAPAGCHPLTNGGKCYEPGEFCRNSDHGVTGVAGDGETITCEDNDGWRWEPS